MLYNVLLACINTIYKYGHEQFCEMNIKFQFLGSGALVWKVLGRYNLAILF